MTSYEDRIRSCPRCPHPMAEHVEGEGCTSPIGVPFPGVLERCSCHINPPRPRCSACGSYIRLDGRCANADCHRWSPEV